MGEVIKKLVKGRGVQMSLLGGSGSVGATLSLLNVTSTRLPDLLADYFLAVGGLYLLRWLTHVRWYVFEPTSWLLRVWVGIEMLVLAAWGYIGWRALQSHSALTVFIASAVACVVVWVLAAEVSGLVAELDIETASARMDTCWLGQRIQLDLLRARLDTFIDWFGDNVARGEVSRYVAVVLTMLVFCVAASLAGAIVGRHVRGGAQGEPPKVAGRVGKRRRKDRGGVHWIGASPRKQTNSTITTSTASTSGTRIGPATGSSTATHPTYQQLCGAPPTGAPAPQPLAADLTAAFLSLGEPASGCAETPTPVGAGSGAWTMAGDCGSQLWSLTVASASGETAVLLGEQPAAVGQVLAREHELIAVSSRTPVGGGQGYAIETVSGTQLLLRPQSSTVEDDTVPADCEQVPDDAVRYQDLPPVLASIWLSMTMSGPVYWPQITSDQNSVTTWVFESPTTPAKVVAQGWCSASSCRVTWNDGDVVRPTEAASLATFAARFG